MKTNDGLKMQVAVIDQVECYVTGHKFGRAILRPKNTNNTISFSIPDGDLPRYLV